MLIGLIGKQEAVLSQTREKIQSNAQSYMDSAKRMEPVNTYTAPCKPTAFMKLVLQRFGEGWNSWILTQRNTTDYMYCAFY